MAEVFFDTFTLGQTDYPEGGTEIVETVVEHTETQVVITVGMNATDLIGRSVRHTGPHMGYAAEGLSPEPS